MKKEKAGGRRANPEKRMSLGGHLIELRNRLFAAAIVVILAAVAGWFLYDPVLSILQSPVEQIAAQEGRVAELNYAGIASPFDMKIKVSLFIGIMLAAPFWLYQIWAFIMPGLTKKEKWYSLGFMAAAIPLFIVGASLAFFAMPNAVKALSSFTPSGATNIIPAQDYLTFVMIITVVFGCAFVLPVLMVGLNMVGILSADRIRKSWRIVVLIVFVFAAIATPAPDAMSMFFLAIPMLLLFFAAWLVCLVGDRRRKRKLIAEGLWVDEDEDDEE
ncbi:MULTISPECIES: twin-arginine translocase subunit TatC [Brevibacterium]|uniref:twin-arginine translocase subunit TatC n=1 Tax=Brevibacterium TaxID=1696 RepID=UPI0031D86829